MTKEAPAQYPLNELIRKRWSPRSFSDKIVSQESMNSLFEAARWSASAGNEQPWEYYYGMKGTPGFDKLWLCLIGNNLPWTKNASVLMLAVTRKTHKSNGKHNGTAQHDLGLANSQMFLQAVSMDIYCHPMAGFDKVKVHELLNLNDDHEPVCMIAIGYLDAPEKLEEPFLTRELAPRVRKTITEFTKQI